MALLVVLGLGRSGLALGEIIIEGEPSPAGKTLRLIADGTATAESIAPQIVAAAEKIYLMPRLLDVLDAYSRDGDTQAEIVSAALAMAPALAPTERSREATTTAAEQLRLRLKNKAESGNSQTGWYRYPSDVPLDVPLTSKSQGEWPMPVFAARLANVLEHHLPVNDRREYVHKALEAFLASSCETFLGGKVIPTCREVGLWPMRYRALALALAGLSSDGSDPSVAEVYLSQNSKMLDQVLEQAQLIHPGGFWRQCRIISKWRQKAPSRWEVWADLEPKLF